MQVYGPDCPSQKGVWPVAKGHLTFQLGLHSQTRQGREAATRANPGTIQNVYSAAKMLSRETINAVVTTTTTTSLAQNCIITQAMYDFTISYMKVEQKELRTGYWEIQSLYLKK